MNSFAHPTDDMLYSKVTLNSTTYGNGGKKKMQITFWAMKECLSVWLLAGTSAPYENEDDDTLSPIFTHLLSPKESRPETQQFAASLETFVNDK